MKLGKDNLSFLQGWRRIGDAEKKLALKIKGRYSMHICHTYWGSRCPSVGVVCVVGSGAMWLVGVDPTPTLPAIPTMQLLLPNGSRCFIHVR